MSEILNEVMYKLCKARSQWDSGLEQLKKQHPSLELCNSIEELLKQMDNKIDEFSRFKKEENMRIIRRTSPSCLKKLFSGKSGLLSYKEHRQIKAHYENMN